MADYEVLCDFSLGYPGELLLVQVLVDGEEDLLLFYRGQVSSLMRATPFDESPLWSPQTQLLRIDRLQARWPNLRLIHLPVHASWLNQVEIYFSIIQRKVLTPNDFTDLDAVAVRLALYEKLSNQTPSPFAWKFNRHQLVELLARIEARRSLAAEAGVRVVA